MRASGEENEQPPEEREDERGGFHQQIGIADTEAARRGEAKAALDRMHIARYVVARVTATQDAKEGIQAFREKRKPVYLD